MFTAQNFFGRYGAESLKILLPATRLKMKIIKTLCKYEEQCKNENNSLFCRVMAIYYYIIKPEQWFIRTETTISLILVERLYRPSTLNIFAWFFLGIGYCYKYLWCECQPCPEMGSIFKGKKRDWKIQRTITSRPRSI